MMLFTDSQRAHLTNVAGAVLIRLDTFSKGATRDYQIGVIAQELEEACSMGRAIALDEVCATPWEYFNQPIQTDAAKNDTLANQLSSQGWDLHMATSGWLIWRRRKAVREIEEVKR